jgi:hypothetical protein
VNHGGANGQYGAGAVVDLRAGDEVKLVDLQVGQEMQLAGGTICVRLEHKNGNIARLRIVADRRIRIQFPAKVPAFQG